MRTFIALDPDPPFRASLMEAVAGLEGRLPGVRWVRPEGMHLTLRFLGESTASRLDSLRGSLRAAAAACPRSPMRASGLHVFPERGRPRVLVVSLELPQSLLALQEACERAAVEAGWPPEDRPFRPHVTLGRFSAPAPRPALEPSELGATAVTEVVLYRSELRRGGAVYTRLDSHPLARP